ncbi:MAG: beta-eliminating lyase [Pseudobacteriovorax sp.]|nr:beta-eliminating lyase [Pseudobacteriovorax sp.]
MVVKSFASDNYSGCLPEVLAYLADVVNVGHVSSYGDDKFTEEAVGLLRSELGQDVEVTFVNNGTAANVIGIDSCVLKTSSIIAPDTSHLSLHESGAPHRLLGCKLLLSPNQNGKISPAQIKKAFDLESKWGRHATVPRLVSIAQPTEFGTNYSIEELSEIGRICKHLGLLLHMDGCRLYNAAVALGSNLKALTFDIGVDILSLGGTKNGLMSAEAIVMRNKDLAPFLPHSVKQLLNLQSKHRFLSGQFIPYLRDRLWVKAAKQANEMATYLSEHLQSNDLGNIIYPVETNQIFARIPSQFVPSLRKKYGFYTYEENLDQGWELVRLITSFDSKKFEIDNFIP